jgi:two-component system, chemotaxis family, protein-glutamate methylesterase/glutaminase
VVAEAENGKLALDILSKIEPDVITLDINMPVMDGLTTLKHIMIIRPTPTVMISALTKEGAMETFDSLKYGAIDFLPKPSQVKGADLKTQQEEIRSKIELAADVQIESVRYLRRPCQKERQGKDGSHACRFIMAIGVAEGGYGALLNVLPSLRADLPAAYVAVMRQSANHIDSFAEYLSRCSHLAVRRVVDGIELNGGTCYLAAANEYVRVAKEGNQIFLQVTQTSDPKTEGPIDFLMRSVAESLQAHAAGIILTGAGRDGIEGLGEVIRSGGVSFVQDPISCLYKETPITAVSQYAIDYLVSDKQMAGAINSYIVSHSS